MDKQVHDVAVGNFLNYVTYLKGISVSGPSLIPLCNPPLLHGMLSQIDFTVSGHREKYKIEVAKKVHCQLNWRVTIFYLKGEELQEGRDHRDYFMKKDHERLPFSKYFHFMSSADTERTEI